MANAKIKWEIPELLNLNNKKVTRGDCNPGLSNIGGASCITGPSASTICVSGVNASSGCLAGSSAAPGCVAGGGDSSCVAGGLFT